MISLAQNIVDKYMKDIDKYGQWSIFWFPSFVMAFMIGYLVDFVKKLVFKD